MATFKFQLLLFLCLSTLTGSATTVIKAFAPDYQGGKVMVYKYQDYLTEKRKFITYTTVDSIGNFTVEFDLKNTDFVQLVIDHVVCELIVAPGKRYNIFVPPLHKGDMRSYGETARVQPVFDNPDPRDVNVIISNLNFAVDSFMLANVQLIGSRNLKPVYLKFREQMLQKLETISDPYIKTHLIYTLADYEFSASIFTPKDLHQKYFSAEISWNHPTYIGFLKSFFQRYFEVFESKYGTGKIVAAIHSRNGGESLLTLLNQDEFLASDTLRQLVTLHALIESKSAMYVRKNMIDCFQYLEVNGATDYIRLIAQTAVGQLTNVAKGFAAYNFGLPNQHNELIALSDLKGKYIYLEIMAPWCSECKTEQALIPAIAKEYEHIMQVVTIVIESDISQYRAHLTKNPWINWTTLHDDTKGEIKQTFEITSLPAYFLIDPTGNYYRVPAKSPSQGIVEDLYPISQKLKESNRPQVGDKQNQK
jgi:thiol-disulfide isomerase/thioredoxin